MPSAYEGTDIISCGEAAYHIANGDISLKITTIYDIIPSREGANRLFFFLVVSSHISNSYIEGIETILRHFL